MNPPMRRVGQAILPLHHGRAPKWLFKRMEKLGLLVSKIIIEEYGSRFFLRQMSNPFFFQSFGCLLGFDWHSSGLTTTLIAALKKINETDLGVVIIGGKGRNSNVVKILDKMEGIDNKKEYLKYISKMSARVDNNLLQDGYTLYHHSLLFDEKGNYAVIQQGMNTLNNYARRYHWFSLPFTKISVEEPHTGIVSTLKSDNVIDLTSRNSRGSRKAILDIVKEGPRRIMRYSNFLKGQKTLVDYDLGNAEKILFMGRKHSFSFLDLDKRSREILKSIYEFQPSSFEELVLFKGMGPKMFRTLALLSLFIYGTKPAMKDPAMIEKEFFYDDPKLYSFAHGGKDGWPFPVDKNIYDKSIKILYEIAGDLRYHKYYSENQKIY